MRLLLLALALGAEAPARAERVTIETTGCPAAVEVVPALAPLLPDAEVVPGEVATARVIDFGRRYRVEAAGEAAEYVDERRDCSARAQTAAVWIALRLRPPAVMPSPAPSTPRRWPWHVDLELSPGLDVALRSPALLAFQPAVRLATSIGPLGLAAGAGGWPWTASVDLPPGSVLMRRLSLDLSGRVTLVRGRVETDLDLGLQLTWLLLEGQDFFRSESATRIEPALRVALRVRGRVTPRWALFGTLALSWVRLPHALVVDPIDPMRPAATTPSLWLTVEGGLSARLH